MIHRIQLTFAHLSGQAQIDNCNHILNGIKAHHTWNPNAQSDEDLKPGEWMTYKNIVDKHLYAAVFIEETEWSLTEEVMELLSTN